MNQIEKAIKKLESIKETAEKEVFVERLAGNVVKEAAAKGEVAGLLIALSVLHSLNSEK